MKLSLLIFGTLFICALFWAGVIVSGFYRWRSRKFGGKSTRQ